MKIKVTDKPYSEVIKIPEKKTYQANETERLLEKNIKGALFG